MDFKRFTLHATTSAILTLNAEAAHAAPCPTEIFGTSLAGQVCNFSVGSSVTVKNGGEVGGITMTGYTPPSSSIVVEAGGLLSSATATGISILSSSLSNGIINNGTINSQSSAVSVANASIISGEISNHGSIATVSGTGIRVVNSSTVNGGISNSGRITAGNNFEGITLGFGSTIVGDITNTGSIQANTNGNGIVITLTSIVDGNISNSGTITAAGAGIQVATNVTINGNITNTGSIIGQVDGLRISNAAVIRDNIVNTGSIRGGNLGILIHSISSANSISNSGTISGGNTGIAVTSSSAINGGISNSGTIQGAVQAIFVDPTSNVGNINILGQQARLIGAVNAVNANVNITNGAIFTSEGNFNVNSFNIAKNAVFNMRNTITTQTSLNNSGTLALGNAPQTVVGNYSQNTGGLFQIDLSNAQNYGQLSVTGAVDLSQSGNINVRLTPDVSLYPGEVFSNIISGNTLTAPTNSYNVTDNSFIWNFFATNTNNAVNLTATINPAVYNVCLGEYCQGAAATIIGQVTAGNQIFNPYIFLSDANQLRIAASQATPELINENIQAIQSITRSFSDITPMWNKLHGVSELADLSPEDHVWIKPYASTFEQNENNTVDGFNAGAYGVAAGKDVELPNNYLFGGALAAGGNNIRGKNRLNGQSIDSQTYQGMLYGAKQFSHHIYLAAEGLMGFENNDARRFIPLFMSTARGSFDSWFTDLRAQLGWNLYSLNKKLVFTPEVDASYLLINQNAYQESSSLMNLAVNSNTLAPVDLGAYGHLVYHLTGLNNQEDATLTGYAGIACDVLNNQSKINAAFFAGGPYFSTFGVKFNQPVFRGGLGLSIAQANKPISVNLNYDAQAGNNAYSNAATVTIIYHYDI